MKRQIMGREVVVAITAGKLDLDLGSRFSTASSTVAAETGVDQSHRRVILCAATQCLVLQETLRVFRMP